ncbi:hypothetical protein [Labilibaculum manganireducens]|uniref:Uncharacterized protein n=1 Tax=Labilibaculum manganireducens TaxID=1940525 RepID=A0A2N3ICY6_9BACT|nr:hypothetical protein [Labilibaculum manganireducens]PKQ68167.1 hypothetical protein BZG01_05320 [Labilibaculum manganireducens]
MNNLNESLAQFLVSTKLLINNSINSSIIKSTVALFGYDEPKLTEAQTLLNTVEDLNNTQQKEYGDQYQAQNDFQTNRKKAHDAYMDLLTIAKIALKNDVSAQQSLGLNHPRKKSFSGWLTQALQFCNNLIASPNYTATMEVYGQGVEKIQAVKQAITDTQNSAEIHKSETGEAQQATQLRDAKLDELAIWVIDYKKIARIALKEQPQLLEKLGLLERS